MRGDGDTTPDWAMDTSPSGPSARASTVQLSPGAIVTGEMRVLAKLGGGGQGDVYEVETPSGRQAIKVLTRELARNAAVVARLEREAATASAVRHPNVVEIYGLERTSSGDLMLRMELLRGRPLDRRMKEGPLSVDEACSLARQIAAGLGAAHARGVIHRDIKPANIFLVETPQGPVAKIMDFGIAKAGGNWDLTAITHTGHLLGTPAYMSPEQILTPEKLDHRTDLYSLGLVFYEMLTGRRAFVAKEVAQILMTQVHTMPVPVRQIRSDVPHPIAEAATRCIAKKPEQRFATAAAFIERLERARLEPDLAPPPVTIEVQPQPEPVSFVPPRPQRSGGAIAVIAIATFALISAVAFAGIMLWSGPETPLVTVAVDPPAEPPQAKVLEVLVEAPRPPPVQIVAAKVRVTSEPPGAILLLGGTTLGLTPFTSELAADVEHRFTVRRDGYHEQVVNVRLRPGEDWHRHVTLEALPAQRRERPREKPAAQPVAAVEVARPAPASPEAPAHGFASIQTTPWSEVSFGGRALGMTPLFNVQLPVGRQQLRFVNQVKGIDVVRDVVIRPGETTKVKVELE